MWQKLLSVILLVACGGGTSSESNPPGTPAPQTRTELQLVRSGPRDGAGPRALGLTGVNKPNGIDQRYRQYVHPQLPAAVPREVEAMQLFIADATAEGWLAFYKGPLPEMPANARYQAALYDRAGDRIWSVDLNQFLSMERHLEIQDVRYRDGVLYFNEACQSYAREADGRCSSLIALDPARGSVLWRTRRLTSNNIFLVEADVIIAGYGFTAEADSLYVIDRRSGVILDAEPLDSAHGYMEWKDGVLHVLTTNRIYEFR